MGRVGRDGASRWAGLALVATAWLAGCTSGPFAGIRGASPPGAGAAGELREGSALAPGAGPEAGGFPSPRELAEVGGGPVPEDLFDLDVRDVETWKLAGPFPERIEAAAYGNTTPWASLVEESSRRRTGLVLPTQAMYCLARELGRFYLATRAQPAEGLRRFMTARCNATEANVTLGYLGGRVKAGYGDAQVFGYWRDAVRRTLESRLAGGPRTVGIWYGRQGERAVVMMAFGVREVHVQPVSPVPAPDGTLEIRGELLTPSAEVTALVNRGRFGVRKCEPAKVVPHVGFAFVCHVDPRDPSALLSLSVRAPDRLLASTALDVLARPGNRPEDTYRVVRYGAPHPVDALAVVAPDFTGLLNDVRQQAGLAPVELDPAQSESAVELAPPFFASLFGRGEPMYTDVVTLGMLAGWSVDGIVQAGHFTASWVLRTNDLQRLLSAALEEPAGREVLLAPEIDRIAVGPMLDTAAGHESLAAIFGSYALFSEEDHEASVRAVMEKLGAARSERGLGPANELDALDPLCAEAASRVATGEVPRDVMKDLLGDAIDVLQRPATGWITEVRDLDELRFPDEYLTRASLGVALAISHREQKGEPWARWVVMVVVADPEARGT